jgi:ParB family chromosome partitioning protein
MDPAALEELAESIRRWGILQPLTVRFLAEEKVYRIITGERRFQAAQQVGLETVPCRVMNPGESDVLVHQIIEDWQRVDLEPFEIADALAALKAAHGYTQKQMADLMGKSEGEISKLLALLGLSPEAQRLARQDASGRITRRHLYAVTRLEAAGQLPFLARILAEEWSAEEAEEVVSRAKPKAVAAKRGAPVTRVRFSTREATVQLTFRKKIVSPEVILKALDEVRRQLTEQPGDELTIIRPK